MKALYKGKKVKVVKLITEKNKFIIYPIITQVKIEYKEEGVTYDQYVDANEITFL